MPTMAIGDPSAHMTAQVDHDALEQWGDAYAANAERDASFATLSGLAIKPLYTERDQPRSEDVGLPGGYPFTGGVYPSMCRGRRWTMRQFAGFGTADETNERFRYLIDHAQTGLSTAFNMPSLMGHDSDHPRSLGEVGREGVECPLAPTAGGGLVPMTSGVALAAATAAMVVAGCESSSSTSGGKGAKPLS